MIAFSNLLFLYFTRSPLAVDVNCPVIRDEFHRATFMEGDCLYIYNNIYIYRRGWKSGNRKREARSASDDEWWSDGGFACKIKIRVERGRKVLHEEDSEARETGWKIRGCLRFVIYKRPFQEAFSLAPSFSPPHSATPPPSFRPPFPLLFIIIDTGTEG